MFCFFNDDVCCCDWDASPLAVTSEGSAGIHAETARLFHTVALTFWHK